MPQTSTPVLINGLKGGVSTPGKLDATGSNNLNMQGGGVNSVLNVTQATAVATGARRLRKISIVSGGSTSGFTVNDAATTTAATTSGSTQSNVIWFANTTAVTAIVNAGGVINFDWPCTNGITVSAVPSAGSPQIAVSYD